MAKQREIKCESCGHSRTIRWYAPDYDPPSGFNAMMTHRVYGPCTRLHIFFAIMDSIGPPSEAMMPRIMKWLETEPKYHRYWIVRNPCAAETL